MKIHRNKAKEILARKQLKQLKVEEKLDILADYWGYDCTADIREDIEDRTLPNIPEFLITLIATTESPQLPLPDEVEPLLFDALLFRLDKVVNSYLELKLRHFNRRYEVEGDVEKAGLCPCCHFYSIGAGEDGLWDICPVCFWENGGDGPNHINIDTARKNFLAFGAIDEDMLQSIDPEGQVKYAREDSL